MNISSKSVLCLQAEGRFDERVFGPPQLFNDEEEGFGEVDTASWPSPPPACSATFAALVPECCEARGQLSPSSCDEHVQHRASCLT